MVLSGGTTLIGRELFEDMSEVLKYIAMHVIHTYIHTCSYKRITIATCMYALHVYVLCVPFKNYSYNKLLVLYNLIGDIIDKFNLPVIILQIEDLATFGIDWDGPSPYDDDDDNTVEIPDTDTPISDLDYDALQQAIDPLASNDSFSIDLFTSTM